MSKIGRLIQVELRDVWKNEAKDFTQWLADNLDCLSDSLNIEMEILETEKKIDDSRFVIDIVAMDSQGQKIIIENQLEKTDHSHLGQIITYATNFDANTIIWITKEPRTEHIKAINWLNEASGKDFYLLQVEAYKIDSSNPAPVFSIICRPSLEAKALGKSKKSLDSVRETRLSRRAAADTIIVPARAEGFKKVFIGENCWYSIRMSESQLGKIKYIAGYQVAPISAITHLAEVKEIIVSPEDPEKYLVKFKGPAKEIKKIPLGENSKIQGPAYCEHFRLSHAKNTDDLLLPQTETKDAA